MECLGLNNRIIKWLLKGDVSTLYQVRRDLLGEKLVGIKSLQGRIMTEGRFILEKMYQYF